MERQVTAVVGAVRDLDKMELVAEMDEFPEELFTPMHVELNSFESVRSFCNELSEWKSGKPVDRLIGDFIEAGASYITFHPEASEHIDRSLQMIRDGGCRSGLVFNPATPLHYLDHVMDKVDMVLLMSVNPGFGGQKFIPGTLDKLRAVRQRIEASGREIRLEVDGGVGVANIAEIARAGADTFVAGSAIFNTEDYRATIDAMRAELAKVG